jgi:hypothetical protein
VWLTKIETLRREKVDEIILQTLEVKNATWTEALELPIEL